MGTPAGPIPFGDLVGRFTALHEMAIHRPKMMSDEQYADYERLANRMCAEFAWAINRRARDAAAVYADGFSEYVPCDLVSNVTETAPRLAEAIMLRLSSIDPDDIADLMDATRDFPR